MMIKIYIEVENVEIFVENGENFSKLCKIVLINSLNNLI